MAVSKPLKYLVLFFNILFLIFGFILLGIGVWGEITHKGYAKIDLLKEYEVNSGPRLLIAIGVIVIIVSFFGCCGAWKENKCLLCVFIFLLVVLLILEITAAALAYKYKGKVKDKLEKELMKKLMDYDPNSNKSKAFDDLQEKIKCCGVNTYKDWDMKKSYNASHSVPDSCCKQVKDGCGKGKLAKPEGAIYEEGCYSKIFGESKKTMSAVGGVAIAILVIQILGIIFAIVLFCQVRNNQDTEEIK